MKIELTEHHRINLPMGVMDVAVDEANERVFVGCLDGVYQCRIDGKGAERIETHDSWVSGIALVDNGKRLISAGYDGRLKFHDIESANPASVIDAHRFWSWKMAASADGKLVASVSGQYLAGSIDYSPQPAVEPTVKVFDSVTGELRNAFSMLPSVQAVAFDPTSQYVAAANLMGDIAVWEIESGRQLASWRTPDFTSWGIIKSHCYIGGIHALCFAPDGESIIAAGMGDMRDPMAGNGRQLWQRFAWREATPTKLSETIKDQAGEGLMEALAVDPQGKWFVMAGRLRGGEWNAGLFSLADGVRVGMLNSEIRITSAKTSRTGEHLYLAGMKNQGGPKDGKWPEFGVIDRYRVTVSE